MLGSYPRLIDRRLAFATLKLSTDNIHLSHHQATTPLAKNRVMRLSEGLSPLGDLRAAVSFGIGPLLKALYNQPSLLLHPRYLSHIFFNGVWSVFGDGIDENSRSLKEALITAHASGVVLEIGAGRGHTAKYLDRAKVTTFVALEPNTEMHPHIRKAAEAASFSEKDGSLIILTFGAEDITSIHQSLHEHKISQVDTLISILTLCSIPNAKSVVRSLVDNPLRPGGSLLYYEHVRNPREDVAWWQDRWTPVWKWFFDGCEMNRPTHLWIEELGCWKAPMKDERQRWGLDDESPTHLFWHQIGHYVKA